MQNSNFCVQRVGIEQHNALIATYKVSIIESMVWDLIKEYVKTEA